MYKTAVSQTYLTPVEIDVPDGKGGSTKHKFQVEFKRLSQSQLDETHRRLDEKRLQPNEQLLSDDELLQDVLVGWRDQKLVLEESGEPAEFNNESRDALLDVFPARPTIVNAFFNSIKIGKRKN